jgi:hypothetical protein
MIAATLIESLSSRGLSVLADGDTIKISPSAALTDEDRQAIRDHKAELLELLRRSEPVADEHCPICGRELEWQRGKYYRHVWCPRPGHFDAWRALGGRKLSETDAPIVRGNGRG